MALKEQLYDEIKKRGYLSYGEMCQLSVEFGHKASYAERALRLLVEEERIDNEMKKSKRNTDYISGYFLKGHVKEKPKTEWKEIIRDGERVMVETLIK